MNSEPFDPGEHARRWMATHSRHRPVEANVYYLLLPATLLLAAVLQLAEQHWGWLLYLFGHPAYVAIRVWLARCGLVRCDWLTPDGSLNSTRGSVR